MNLLNQSKFSTGFLTSFIIFALIILHDECATLASGKTACLTDVNESCSKMM